MFSLPAFATCLNSTYLVIHGTLKIMNKCGVSICVERQEEEGDS